MGFARTYYETRSKDKDELEHEFEKYIEMGGFKDHAIKDLDKEVGAYIQSDTL